MEKKQVVLVAGVGLVFGGGYAMGQKPGLFTDSSADKKANDYWVATNRDNGAVMAQVLSQSIGDRELTESLMKLLIQWNDKNGPADMTYQAVTMLQNQKLIEQNDQIIKLLEEQAKKK